DLTRGQADLAVRTRAPAQSDLMVPFAARTELGVFVSGDYARRLRRRCRAPFSIADIDWITWSYPNEHLPPRPQLEQLIPDFRPAFASNDYLAQQRAVALGLGAMILPRTHHPHQSTGRLVELPVTLPLPAAVILPRRRTPPPSTGRLVALPATLPRPAAEVYVVGAKTMRWVPRVQAVRQALRQLCLSVEGVTELDAAAGGARQD